MEETAERRLMSAAEKVWNTFGSLAFPITARVSPGFKWALDACYSNTYGVLPVESTKIESDLGTIEIIVSDDPDLVLHGFLLEMKR